MVKWNQMTALGCQTGRGGERDIRHPRPPFGGLNNLSTNVILTSDSSKWSTTLEHECYLDIRVVQLLEKHVQLEIDDGMRPRTNSSSQQHRLNHRHTNVALTCVLVTQLVGNTTAA